MMKPAPLACALSLGLAAATLTAATTGTVESTADRGAALAPAANGALNGRVSSQKAPLDDAAVYAYQLANAALSKSFTDDDGKFSFSDLPAGLYKIIAYKQGFVPAVVLLTRATASAYQFLDFELSEESLKTETDGSDFWTIRGRIPSDVLRDLRIADAESAHTPAAAPTALAAFTTEMQALAGVGSSALVGEAQLTDTLVGVAGRLGSLELGFRGHLRQLEPSSLRTGGGDASGESQALALSLEATDDSRLQLLTERASLVGAKLPVALERYGVSWSQPVGTTSRSSFTAQFTDQNNFYRDSSYSPLELPASSRSFRVEGSYETRLSDHSIQTGVRYRQRILIPEADAAAGLPYERIDVFGLDGWSVLPSVMVELGLFSTLTDGRLSLTPHGGALLDLGSRWSAAVSARQRISEEEGPEALRDFVAMHYAQGGECGTVEQHCYEIELARELDNEGERISVAALHREFADTVRLYFSDDFFRQLESLFLVRGDSLPQVKLALGQRLSTKVFAELESYYGSGGGGIYRAADNATYRNAVRYLGTSLNTEFEQTSTALFVGFDRIEQELSPLDQRAGSAAPLALDRLQILLTQDLAALLDMATDLALLLDMQLSRGSTPYDQLSSHELRHQVVGGIAVKF
jgi:hypothetical protein